jgi:hypothetical protein
MRADLAIQPSKCSSKIWSLQWLGLAKWVPDTTREDPQPVKARPKHDSFILTGQSSRHDTTRQFHGSPDTTRETHLAN